MSDEVKETPEVSPEERAAETYIRAMDPSQIPEQFGGDPEKFLQSWKEQRKTLTQAQQKLAELSKKPEAQPAPEAKQAAASSLEIPKTPEDAPDVSEAEWSAWTEEVLISGDLSKATRDTIKTKYKIPDAVIDGYLNAQKAARVAETQQAVEVVGGREQLDAILKWASSTMDEKTKAATNAAMKSAGWKSVLLGLKAQYEAATPKKSASVETVSRPHTGIQPFDSPEEYRQAYLNPKYKTDPEFKNLVHERSKLTHRLANKR